MRESKYIQFSQQSSIITSLPQLGVDLNASNLEDWLEKAFFAASYTNNMISSLGFNSGNGVLTLTLNDTPNTAITANLDGRYSLTSHNHTLDSLSNVTITGNTSGELLKWNGSAWINNTLVEAGISAIGHTHTLSDITDAGSLAALNTINNSNWSGTDLSVSNGGTGASTLTGLLQGNGTGAITGGATINNSNWSGTALDETNGGTGITTYTAGDLLYASATNTLSKLGIGSSGQVLKISTGLPQWQNETTITVGTNDQIPYSNIGGTDFDYSSNLTFDGTTFVANNISLAGTTITGTDLVLTSSGSLNITSTENIIPDGLTGTLNLGATFAVWGNVYTDNIRGRNAVNPVSISANTADYAVTIFNDGDNANRDGLKVRAGEDSVNPTLNEFIGLFSGADAKIASIGADGTLAQLDIRSVTGAGIRLGDSSGNGFQFGGGGSTFLLQPFAVATNQDLLLDGKGTGKVSLSGLLYPNTDGTNGQVLSTNGSGVLSWIDSSSGISGTFTPTISNTTNHNSSSIVSAHYLRVGNIVFVSVSLQFDAVTASISTSLTLSHPIATGDLNNTEVIGSGAVENITTDNTCVYVEGVIGADLAILEWTHPTNSQEQISVTYSYRIIS